MTAQDFIQGCEHDGSFIPVGEVIRLMNQYSYIKCLEAIKNTQYKSIEIINDYHHRVDTGNGEHDVTDLEFVTRDIQNIKNEDVLPTF